ncbi:MAG: hypothetical protein E4H00_02095 [Myxococcales bacterium]|nr:MAG: hypothetical protein E4H00_02095 [Myxococcales bacterium]
MATESNDRKVIVSILMTSTLLTMLGIAGVLRGAYDLSQSPLPEDVRELYEPEEEVTDAQVQLFEAQVTNPYRRPLAAANVIVSGLVLIGSFLLSWRRKLALWWIKQAVVAKLMWIAVYTISLVSHVKLTFQPLPLGHPGGALEEVMWSVILLGTLSGALHAAAAYRATRPEIGRFIESSADR